MPDSRVGISHALPFSAALWRYVSYQTGLEETHLRRDASKTKMDAPRRMLDTGKPDYSNPPVENAEKLRKEILMMSLNPSVYGNKFSPLGSS
jgi:hypothetical protein